MKAKFIVYDCDGGGFGAHLYSLFQYYSIAQYCDAELYCVNPLITTYLDCKKIANTELEAKALTGRVIRLKTLMDNSNNINELKEKIVHGNYDIILCGYHHYHKFFTRNSKDILGGSRKIAQRNLLYKIGLNIEDMVEQAKEEGVIDREIINEYKRIKDVARKGCGILSIHLRTLKDSEVGRMLYMRSRRKMWYEFKELTEQYSLHSIYLLSDDKNERMNFERYLGQKTIHMEGKGLEWHSSLKVLYGINLLITERSIEAEMELIKLQIYENKRRLYKFLLPMMEWDLMTNTNVMISTGSCYSTTAYLISKSCVSHIKPYSTYGREFKTEELF